MPAQFALNRSERRYHDVLARLLSTRFLLTVIASRGDDFPVGHIRLRVANQDDGEHIDFFRVESGQGSNLDLLVSTPCLTHIADRRVSTALLQEQFLQAIELPITAMRLGVVDSCHEVADGSRLDSPFNHLPGRHQVGERDDSQVVACRGSQQ